MTWTRTELEDAFAGYQNTVVECTRSGDWNAFADMFTEDVVYVEHAFGTLNGREAVRKWVTRTMTEFPGHRMTEFPANWFVVDQQRGWIVCEIDNPMEIRVTDPSTEPPTSRSCITPATDCGLAKKTPTTR